MDFVNILLELSRRRLLVALVAVLAIAAGWAVAYKATFPPQARSYEVGIATAQILVDTPRSQVVEVSPRGSETLGARANVLASLMVDGEIKELIARRAGLRPQQLLTAAQVAGDEEARSPGPRDYALKTGVVLTSDQAELPFIRVEAQAPDTRSAAKLADAAVAGLGEYLDSKAADEPVADDRRLQVSGLGQAQAHSATRGPGRIMALAVAVLIFVIGCGAIVLGSTLVREWRLAVDLEQAFAADALDFAPVEAAEVEAEPETGRGRTAGLRL